MRERLAPQSQKDNEDLGAMRLPIRLPTLSPTWSRNRFTNESMTEDQLIPIGPCRVAYADYAALRSDLDWESGTSNTSIDRWLLENAALLSVSQINQSSICRDMVSKRGCRIGYRPPRYGRAVLLDTERGVLDLKGVGVARDRRLTTDAHGNGLVLFADALMELCMQALVDRALAWSGSPIHTLPIYAILDTGSLSNRRKGEPVPTAIIVRRAHHRPQDSDLPRFGSPGQRLCFELEGILRHFGLTSASGPVLQLTRQDAAVRLDLGTKSQLFYSNKLWDFLALSKVELPFVGDQINIQATDELNWDANNALIVDFEHYVFRSRFSRPLVSVVCDRPLGWGGSLSPSEPGFVHTPSYRPNCLIGDSCDMSFVTRSLSFDELVNKWQNCGLSRAQLARELMRRVDEAIPHCNAQESFL